MSKSSGGTLQARVAAPVAACLIALTGWVGSALGGPENGTTIRGIVSIIEDPSNPGNWLITATDGSIVQYSSFDILSNELVHFQLDTDMGRILNRITGDFDGTQINGQLTSNGILYFVNPAGVFIGSNGVINVGGIYAAAGDISNDDFISIAEGGSGIDRFSLDLNSEINQVINEGTITAELVHLLGEYVANRGTIDVGDGVVTMISGNTAIISPRDLNGHVVVTVIPFDPGLGGEGEPGFPGVFNEGSGQILANSGQIVLGAGDLFSLAIRNDGLLQADNGLIQMQVINGDIENHGTIEVAGGLLEMFTGESGDITESGIISSVGGALDFDAAGNVFLETSLSADSVNAAGSSIFISTDAITGEFAVGFDGDVVLNQTTTITGDVVDFNGRVDSADGGNYSLTVNANETRFGGRVGDLTSLNTLTTDADGTTTIDTDIINASSELIFLDDVVLERSAMLSGFFNVEFGGRVDSAGGTIDNPFPEFNNLTVNSFFTTFSGEVGNRNGSSLLGSLITDPLGTTVIDTGVVTALNGVTFFDDVVINQDTVISGIIQNVAFFGIVYSQAGEFNDLIIISQNTVFNGQVGNNQASLAFEQAEGESNTSFGLLSTGPLGRTTINTDVVRAENVNFSNDVVIAMDTTIIGTSSVIFGDLVDSDANERNDLVVNSPLTFFNGQIGNSGSLPSGMVGDDDDDDGTSTFLGLLSTDVDGLTTINTDVVNAENIVFDDDVIVDADTTLTGLESVHFNGRLDSQFGEFNDLVVRSPDTVFNDRVGDGFLGDDDDDDEVGLGGGDSLTRFGLLQTDADGTTIINTDIVNGTDLDFQDDVIIDQDTMLTGIGIFPGSGSVNFAAAVDSTDFEFNDLSIYSPTTQFHGRVGDRSGLSQLGTLFTDAGGTMIIDTDRIVAANGLDINDDVILLQDTALTGGFFAEFHGRIDSDSGEEYSLHITSQDTQFHGQIGNSGLDTQLGALETDASGTTTIATDVISSRTVTFNDDVWLASDTTINSDLTTFERRLDDLVGIDEETKGVIRHTMAITGDAIFNDEVGGVTKLGGLEVQGVTHINGGLVNADSQEYHQAVCLGCMPQPGDDDDDYDGSEFGEGGVIHTIISGDTQLIFRDTLEGEGSLLVVGAGDALFEGDIMLGSFETELGGVMIFDTVAINTLGDVIFNNAVVLFDVPSVATIGSHGDLTITASNFSMGQNQKLSVVGNLIINVEGGTATLADIGTLGFLDVNAATINLRLRGADEVETPEGTFTNDFGIDIVAGGGIRFSVTPDSLNKTTNPRIHFSSPTGEGDLNGNLLEFIMHAGGTVTIDDIIAADGRFLDLYAKGPTTADMAESLAAAFAREANTELSPREISPDPNIRQRLQTDLTIPARVLNDSEIIDLLAGRALYLDSPGSGIDPTRLSSQVVVNRLRYTMTMKALQTYDLLVQGRTPEQVRSILDDAWAAYNATAGENADPAGLAAFVQESGNEAAMDQLRLIKQLINEIEIMGLAPTESKLPIANLASRFVPEGISTQVFSRILAGVD